jgi:conjugative transfer pilus assembly protein TraH
MRLLITPLVLTLLLAQTAHAGWVDDWLQQQATTSPDYLSGQQRGYYAGGSFSGRWRSTAEYPVTVEMPRINSGCGGIDVFMGGFSFMNTDYLVDKLQAILTNASAVAFDLALKTLCEQCSNTIKNFEALADKLNSMQIDECAAAKELVGIQQFPISRYALFLEGMRESAFVNFLEQSHDGTAGWPRYGGPPATG